MSDIAVSNMTNAVIGLAEGFSSFEGMYKAWRTELRAEMQTVIHGDDAAAKAAAQRVDNVLIPRMEQYLANMSGQLQAAVSVASQLPSGGSVAATTGAVQTVADGEGVAGVPGVPADLDLTPAEGPGPHLANKVGNTGIIGQQKQVTDENEEAKPLPDAMKGGSDSK